MAFLFFIILRIPLAEVIPCLFIYQTAEGSYLPCDIWLPHVENNHSQSIFHQMLSCSAVAVIEKGSHCNFKDVKWQIVITEFCKESFYLENLVTEKTGFQHLFSRTSQKQSPAKRDGKADTSLPAMHDNSGCALPSGQCSVTGHLIHRRNKWEGVQTGYFSYSAMLWHARTDFWMVRFSVYFTNNSE